MTASTQDMKQYVENPRDQFDDDNVASEKPRCRLLVYRKGFSLLFVFAGVAMTCGAVETPFNMSSLVLPQGVSYTLGPVTLTRALEQATSANKTGKTSSLQNHEASSTKKTVGSGVEFVTSSGHSSGYNLGGSIGGSSGGSGSVSLMGLLGVNLSISGKVSGEDSSRQKTTNHNGTESALENSRQSASGSSSEFEEQEQYGSYHLRFTVSFKSKDPSDTFLVGGPNASVILNGFSAPVKVPYTERNVAVRLGAEERILFFDYPIADQVTLRDAKRFAATGRRNAVTLSLTGDDFPVVSERTTNNVVSEITRIMQTIPNTVVSLDIGDVKRLSPWRIRRKFARSSGRGGQRVTIREALEALNEVIAKDEEMPEVTFKFAQGGRLDAVGDTPALAPSRNDDLTFIAVSVVTDTHEADTEVHFPTKAFLSRPLSDFMDVRFVQLQFSELAQMSVKAPETVKTLREEVESVLSSVDGAEKLWHNLCGRYEQEDRAKKEEETAKPKPAKEVAEGEHHTGATKTIELPGGETMVLCWCPAGDFLMGFHSNEKLSDADKSENPLHRVHITKGFWLGKYEVTQSQWQSVMGCNPSGFKDPQRPVEQVSWEDCQMFLQRVRCSTGLDIRLPTEAEWEYACRAGTYGAWQDVPCDTISWHKGNSNKQTWPVGQKKENAWGLYDMIGNVAEWCSDWFDENYYFHSPANDPENATAREDKYSMRVVRGGGWDYGSYGCSSAYRDREKQFEHKSSLGFRLCCSAGLCE